MAGGNTFGNHLHAYLVLFSNVLNPLKIKLKTQIFMKQILHKNLDTIVRTTIIVGLLLAVAGGAYAYYVNQIIR